MKNESSRRSFLAAGGAIAAGAFLAACASGNPGSASTSGGGSASAPASGGAKGAGKKVSITITPFAGANLAAMPTAFAQYYQEKNPNVSITLDDTVLFTKQVAGYKADPNKPLTNLAFSNSASTATGKALGMYAKLDYSRIPNTAGLVPHLVEKDHCGVALGADQMGIVSNKHNYPSGLNSWSDLWSPEQRGKECYFTTPWWAIGVAASEHGGSWTNMDAGFGIWQQNAQNIRTIVTANPQFLNVLASGEAPLTSHYFGTCNAWAASGAPLQYNAPQEGVFFDSISVNVVAASSSTTLTPKLKALPQISAGSNQKFVSVDWDTVGQNLPAWTDRWNQDVVSKI
jgi:putative spermidine/putrescine transport system substrate-binding protein